MIKRLKDCTKGGTAIEYGLILALIVLAMMVALEDFASTSIRMWSNVSTKVQNAS